MIRKSYYLVITLLLLALVYTSCLPSHKKTGEFELYKSKDFRVVVVQIYEAMPWHYYGLTHQVWCQSPKTMEMNWQGIDGGWNRIGYSTLSIPGQSPTKETRRKGLDAAVAEESIHVIDRETIVRTIPNSLSISFDGCAHFSEWSARHVPKDSVARVLIPAYCQAGNNECPWWEDTFRGDRQILISDISIDPRARTISFRAQSKAFKDKTLRVVSKDAGVNWEISRSMGHTP